MLQDLQAGNVIRYIGADRAILGVDPEKHHAVEPMAFRQDLRQLRQGLFRTVLLIGGAQDNQLPFAVAVTARDRDPGAGAWRELCVVSPARGRQCYRHADQESAHPSTHPFSLSHSKSRRLLKTSENTPANSRCLVLIPFYLKS